MEFDLFESRAVLMRLLGCRLPLRCFCFCKCC